MKKAGIVQAAHNSNSRPSYPSSTRAHQDQRESSLHALPCQRHRRLRTLLVRARSKGEGGRIINESGGMNEWRRSKPYLFFSNLFGFSQGNCGRFVANEVFVSTGIDIRRNGAEDVFNEEVATEIKLEGRDSGSIKHFVTNLKISGKTEARIQNCESERR